jgi:glycosyltransferase involved in cell wall biosynthesis
MKTLDTTHAGAEAHTAPWTSPGEARAPADDGPDVELTVLMPCLDEAETLGVCIRKALQGFQRHGIAGEVVVADNGSSDGSQEIAHALGVRVVDIPIRGYGAALIGGIEAARGRYIVMGDADDSYDFSDLMPFLRKLREGDDLVMGNRFLGGIAPGAMPPLHRYLGNPVLTGIGRLLFRSPATDFHCGLRGFSKRAALAMDLRTTGMEFASEMVVKATIARMRISEVPTTLSPDGRSRPPHLRSWRDGWRHLRFLLLYSPRFVFLYPGALFMLVGAAAGLWLLPGPRRVGAVSFDIGTLLFAAAAVVLGFESVTSWVLAKVFAISEHLLPPDPRMDRLFRWATLETCLIAGGVLLVAGFALAGYALTDWGRREFGPLDPERSLRVVTVATTTMILGVQTILASFLASLLRLRRI